MGHHDADLLRRVLCALQAAAPGANARACSGARGDTTRGVSNYKRRPHERPGHGFGHGVGEGQLRAAHDTVAACPRAARTCASSQRRRCSTVSASSCTRVGEAARSLVEKVSLPVLLRPTLHLGGGFSLNTRTTYTTADGCEQGWPQA